MQTITAKFGGSSLADAGQFLKVKKIIEGNSARRFIVVSAPGKRYDTDEKVTDMLNRCWQLAISGNSFDEELQLIASRFKQIISEASIAFDIDKEISVIATNLLTMPHRDYVISRGEYLNTKLLSVYLGMPFVDPALHVHFTEEGILDEVWTKDDLSSTLLKLPCAVIAGFYGSKPDGSIKTFSRGGSDVTGAIVAEAVGADLYENWTDVSGLLAADPRIVETPKTIDYLSYRELRLLSYMGASVMHTDAVQPVRKRSIPINIRNTNEPDNPGTMIVAEPPKNRSMRSITGVAGRKGLCAIQAEKTLVSDGAGFTAILLDIFKAHKIPFEQCLTGIDTVTVIIRSDNLNPQREEILSDIKKALSPEVLTVKDNLSMITIVGENVSDNDKTSIDILSAISNAGINISTINQGAGRLNLIIGVSDTDYKRTIELINEIITKSC